MKPKDKKKVSKEEKKLTSEEIKKIKNANIVKQSAVNNGKIVMK